MARGRPNQAIMTSRKYKKLAKTLNALGSLLDAEDGDQEEIVAPEKVERVLSGKRDTQEDQVIEAEAVLLYFNLHGSGFTRQVCPECKRTFAYKYKIGIINGLKCSNTCRAAALAKIGIKWDYHKKPEVRWGLTNQTRGEIPLIVPAAALEVVDAALRDQQESAKE